jgi:hypothetical protein
MTLALNPFGNKVPLALSISGTLFAMARTSVGQVPRHGPAEGGLLPAPKLAAQRRGFVLLRRQVRRQAPSELAVSQLSILATVMRSGPLAVGQLAEAEVREGSSTHAGRRYQG